MRKENLRKNVKESESEHSNGTESFEKLNDDGELYSVTKSMDQNSDSWFFDIGCTYHVYSSRDLSGSYKAYDGGSVLVGNNALYKSIAIGTVRVKIFDGLVRTITDARHGPYECKFQMLRSTNIETFLNNGDVKVLLNYCLEENGIQLKRQDAHAKDLACGVGDARRPLKQTESVNKIWCLRLR